MHTPCLTPHNSELIAVGSVQFDPMEWPKIGLRNEVWEHSVGFCLTNKMQSSLNYPQVIYGDWPQSDEFRHSLDEGHLQEFAVLGCMKLVPQVC